jgi:hypothetical protein
MPPEGSDLVFDHRHNAEESALFPMLGIFIHYTVTLALFISFTGQLSEEYSWR